MQKMLLLVKGLWVSNRIIAKKLKDRKTSYHMDMKSEQYLKSRIRDVKDFPKSGIVFKDITTLLKDPRAFKIAIDEMTDYCRDKDADVIVGAESRGFIFGSVIAYNLGKPFVLVRKKGKLPADTIKEDYELEYGSNTVEIHKDSIEKGQRVMIVDDLLATGGTALASAKLVEKIGGNVVGMLFLTELAFLNGQEKLNNYAVHSLLKYE